MLFLTRQLKGGTVPPVVFVVRYDDGCRVQNRYLSAKPGGFWFNVLCCCLSCGQTLPPRPRHKRGQKEIFVVCPEGVKESSNGGGRGRNEGGGSGSGSGRQSFEHRVANS